MMSMPALACETAVLASRSSDASFRISYSSAAIAVAAAAPTDCACGEFSTIPQCPCDMYSQRQTSPISSRLGTSRLIARAALCTMPSSAHAPVAISSFDSGSPNRITLGMPRDFTSAHSFTASSMERLNTPGMEPMGLRIPSPGHTNSGYTNPSGLRRVSRTNERMASLRRRRRGRSIGNAITENSSTAGVAHSR